MSLSPPIPRPRQYGPPQLAGFVVGVGLILYTGCAMAVYLDWSPKLWLREEYNSNVTLVREHGPSHQLHLVAPSLGIVMAKDRWRFDGQLGYERRSYGGSDRLDSDNWHARLAGQYSGRIDQWQLAAGFEQSPTIESELLTTGLTQFNVKRYQRELQPSWQRRWSARTLLSLDARYAKVSYDGDVSRTGLIDYDIVAAAGTLSHDWSHADRSSVTVSILDYGTSDGLVDANDLSLQFSASHRFSPRRSLSLGIGLRQSRTQLRRRLGIFLLSTHERQRGGLASVSWDQALAAVTSLHVEVTRRLDPASDGRLQTSDRLDSRLSHRLSPRLYTTLSLTLLRRRDVAADLFSSRLDRRYYRLSPALSWRIDREWRLRTYLTYHRQSYDVLEGGAIGRIVGIQLTYLPLDAMRLGRL